MIPYFEVSPWTIWGSTAVEPFGALVVIGCAVGIFAARRYAAAHHLDLQVFPGLVLASLFPGLLMSHWLALLLYHPDAIELDLKTILNVASPMSSYGGFLGAFVGGVIYLKIRGLPTLPYADALTFGLVVGWIFGRLGCTLVHDHPGKHTDFFLAIRYPDGPRHDLGFYELLFTLVLAGVLISATRRDLAPGTVVGITCVLYAPVRFLLDFLRVGDRLYLGLTPGQYFSVLALIVGLWILWRIGLSSAEPRARDAARGGRE